MIVCSGSQVMVVVKLEREDEEEGSPHVIAPFFPQVRSLSDHLSQGSYNNTRVTPYKFKGMLSSPHQMLAFPCQRSMRTTLLRGWDMLGITTAIFPSLNIFEYAET